MVLAWVLATGGLVISLGYKSSSTFDPTTGKCMSDVYDNEAAQVAIQVAVAMIVILRLFLITIENIILCVIAMRSSRRQENSRANYKALIMVCALSGLFITSWAPYIIYRFMKSNNPNTSRPVELLAFHCIFINSFGNPILYTLTNKRFGIYVKGLLREVFCCLCQWKITTAEDSSRVNGTGENLVISAKQTQRTRISDRDVPLKRQGNDQIIT